MTIPNTRESAAEAEHPIPLRENVKEAIRRYLEDMGNSQPDSLYRTLLAEVWGFDTPERIETRTVDMHIAKLRKKIEDQPHDPAYIVTVHRVGYKFTG